MKTTGMPEPPLSTYQRWTPGRSRDGIGLSSPLRALWARLRYLGWRAVIACQSEESSWPATGRHSKTQAGCQADDHRRVRVMLLDAASMPLPYLSEQRGKIVSGHDRTTPRCPPSAILDLHDGGGCGVAVKRSGLARRPAIRPGVRRDSSSRKTMPCTLMTYATCSARSKPYKKN